MTARTTAGEWQLETRISVTGGEVAAGVFGHGPPIVLVHGTPAWSYLWRHAIPLLSETHTVHVWDLLGFGHSRLAEGNRPSIAQQAQALADLVAYWDLDQPDLVGHDIGGGIVLRAHLCHGVPARRLALLDAAVLGPWNTPFTDHIQRHQPVYRTMPAQVFTDIATARMRSAVHRELPADVLGGYLAPWLGDAGQQRWIDQVAAVTSDDTRVVAAHLDEVTAPTLVLWGEQDHWLTPTVGDRLAAAIPGARRLDVPAAGHFLPEDAPAEVAAALLDHFA